jgi:stage V sporulation protein B
MAGAYRGWYEGMNDMKPTAVSQITEAVFKAVFGLMFAYYAVKYGVSDFTFLPLWIRELPVPALAAAGATLGLTLSEFFGTAALFVIDTIKDKRYLLPRYKCGKIAGELFKDSLPLTFAAVIANVSGFFDMLTLPPAIANAAAANEGYFLSHYTYGITPGIALKDLPDFIYGSYCGITLPLCGIIPTIVMMANKGAMPTLSRAYSEYRCTGNKFRLNRQIKLLLKFCCGVSIPAGIALALFAPFVLQVLYPTRAAEAAVALTPLVISALTAVLTCVACTILAVTNAVADNKAQILLTLVCSGVKLAGNAALTPLWGASGAAAATALSYVAVIMTAAVLLKRKKSRVV